MSHVGLIFFMIALDILSYLQFYVYFRIPLSFSTEKKKLCWDCTESINQSGEHCLKNEISDYAE